MVDSHSTFKLLPVYFNRSWWQLITRQKWSVLLIIFAVTVTQIMWSLLPFAAAKIFEAQSFVLCGIVFISWIVIDLLFTFIRKNVNTRFQLQCIHSIYKSAHEYLLTIDPKYHVHRSSGAVLAKIERAARGYEDFADRITFDITPLFIGLGTVIIALGYYSVSLAVVMGAFIIAMLLIGYYFATTKCIEWEHQHIIKDDAYKTTSMENLTQIHLIRSTFATPFRYQALNNSITENITTEASLWHSYINLSTGLGVVYLGSLLVLALMLIYQIHAHTLSSATALGLFLVYTQSSKEIIKFNRLLRKIMHSKAAIKDFFSFISHFGEQTFPVLGQSSLALPLSESIKIEAATISFDYGKALLFNDHSLKLVCPIKQPSKLYGIIGASGTGKTTLLSILGGQLKPINGSIIINGINVYEINDAMRSQLIALQGQVASNMRGTIKSNLLLGLPHDHGYSDAALLTIIDQVGLLAILNQHNGLDTLLGEGGLNLSGGQRQRLNFAGLYLRAKYYKPLLILIDEPTSSLDEISELAITHMIEDLAKEAVTLVVAHRLKTINKAVGIIDLSLLNTEKIITAHSPDELSHYSDYYKELLQGTKSLDE